MSVHLTALLQGAVEYGALSGSSSSALRRLGQQPAVAWVADHMLLVLVVVAVLIVIGFRRPRRRY